MCCKRFILLLALLSIVFPSANRAGERFDPPAVYLTWQRDPATTMTVHWHTREPERARESVLQFRGASETGWQTVSGFAVPMLHSDRMIHTVEIRGLRPNSDYVFRFGGDGLEYRFRTMPADLSSPVRFISTGDLYHRKEWLTETTKVAANLDPAFIVVGGDLAYDDVKPERVDRWHDLFEIWKNEAVTPDGRLIPIVVAIGNHETIGFWYQTPAEAPLFYSLFAFPGKQGYNVLDFGKYMSVVLLDSYHTRPVDGAQTKWLADILSKRRSIPHVFPVYHVPAFPSCRTYEGGENGAISELIRKHWCPLFEKNRVKLAFENHDHAFKRTHPIKAERVHRDGVVYLGDGAWGVRTREHHPVESTWYLAKAASVRHFFLVTIYPEQRHVLTITHEGKVIDELYQRVK